MAAWKRRLVPPRAAVRKPSARQVADRRKHERLDRVAVDTRVHAEGAERLRFARNRVRRGKIRRRLYIYSRETRQNGHPSRDSQRLEHQTDRSEAQGTRR